MIRILIIDDNIDRMQQIVSWINEYEIEFSYDYVITKEDAIKKLSVEQYDLVLVDIVLPNTISKPGISSSAGLEIINEINYSKTLIKPLCTLGITSNEESYEMAKDTFEKNFTPLAVWQEDNTQWKEKFIAKIKYISKLSENYRPININKVDTVILATVDDEFMALDTLPVDWQDFKISNDPLIYSKALITTMNNCEKTILRVKLPEMGMSAASHVTTKLIQLFEPSSLVMIGICGGKKEEVNLGDIIIADKTWDYGSGKIKTDDKGNISFSALPNQINMDAHLKSEIIRNSKIVDKISEKWNCEHNDNKKSEIKTGAITTGSAVVANKEIIEKIITPQYRKFLGIDMETYGVYFACENYGQPLKYVSIKAVSDFADLQKDDSYHEYCSYASAHFAFKLIDSGIL